MIESKKIEKKDTLKKKRRDYLYATGKRKSAIARIRIYPRKTDKVILINDKKLNEYFPTVELQNIVISPLKKLDLLNKYYITIKVIGGGYKSQAESVRHGISRILVSINSDYRKTLKGEGLLTRDSRKKERKKPGLKRARRAPQWAKR